MLVALLKSGATAWQIRNLEMTRRTWTLIPVIKIMIWCPLVEMLYVGLMRRLLVYRVDRMW
jgi:hypothetical protein